MKFKLKYNKASIVAEAGCNHKGDMSIAKELIRVAAYYCKADVIKFQKRCNKELLTEEQYSEPHPNPVHSYGETYGEHREFLELSIEQHKELKEYCEQCGIEYATSVWDLTSAKEVEKINPKYIKIPSACNNHYEMIEWLCENYKGEIHLSLGMTTHEEEEELISFFESKKRNKDVVLYACTSGYPVPYEDICLLELNRIKEKFGKRVKSIGFSGHHLGIEIDMAAYTLGASVIERHYTLDKTWKGTDHAASLEPEEIKNLVQGLEHIHLAMKVKGQDILPIEKIQRDKLKYKK